MQKQFIPTHFTFDCDVADKLDGADGNGVIEAQVIGNKVRFRANTCNNTVSEWMEMKDEKAIYHGQSFWLPNFDEADEFWPGSEANMENNPY